LKKPPDKLRSTEFSLAVTPDPLDSDGHGSFSRRCLEMESLD